MPTYDYRCDACEHRFEEFQSMTQKPLRKCPQCGKNKLQRLIGAGAGVIFKGSGFYQTDYKSTGKGSDDAPKGGCAPTCGTDQAPSGCGMKKDGGTGAGKTDGGKGAGKKDG